MSPLPEDRRERAPIEAGSIEPGLDADFESIAQRLRAANDRIEAPSDLLARIEDDIRAETVERRFRRAGSMLAAAAVLTLGLTAWWFVGRGNGGSVPPPVAEGPTPVIVQSPDELPGQAPGQAEDPARLVRVDFDPQSPHFGRRVESTKSNVTIHLIYQSATPLEPAADGAEPEAMLTPLRGAST